MLFSRAGHRADCRNQTDGGRKGGAGEIVGVGARAGGDTRAVEVQRPHPSQKPFRMGHPARIESLSEKEVPHHRSPKAGDRVRDDSFLGGAGEVVGIGAGVGRDFRAVTQPCSQNR
jgi:hypothetical protein